MFLRSTFTRFSPSGRMIKSPLLSLTPVEKDHTKVTQAFKSHASKDWVKPNKYQHLSFEFLSWKSFTFNFLVKKGCKCGWIFGSLNYRAQLMNIALNNWNCESKYKHYQKVAFITWVYLIFSCNAYFITKNQSTWKEKRWKAKERKQID